MEVSFGFQFAADVEEYWFAFCYPWSYEENWRWLAKLEKEHKDSAEGIYFSKEVLTETLERRKMHVLTVSSTLHMLKEKEKRFNKSLFPLKNKVRANK